MNLSRKKKLTITYIITLLIIASIAGTLISNGLEIKYKSKNIPKTKKPKIKTYAGPPSLPENIGAIVAPENAMKDQLYKEALKTLKKSIENRTKNEVQILYPSSSIPSGKIITVGNHERNSFTPQNTSLLENSVSDSFALKNYEKGNRKILAVIGGNRLGDVFGVYRLSDEIITGETINVENIFSENYTSTPAMKIRMVDLGGVGLAPNPDVWWQNYSMNPQRFENVVSADPPFVKEKAFQRVKKDFKKYVRRMVALG